MRSGPVDLRVPWVRYSENYITLPPGCTISVDITFEASEEVKLGRGSRKFVLLGRAWNSAEALVEIPVPY
jgi:hypothetical protein